MDARDCLSLGAVQCARVEEWCVLQPAASEGSEHTSLSLVTRGGEWERGGGFAQHTTHLHPSAPLYLHHWHSGEHTCLLLALSTHEGDNSFTIHLFPHLCAQCTQVCKSVQKRKSVDCTCQRAKSCSILSSWQKSQFSCFRKESPKSFSLKMSNLNLWVTNLANEALVIINSPSDVGRVRFNKPPIFNHVRRWRDLLILGSPQTCHTVDLGRMSSNREILGLIAFCYHGGRLSWKRRGTFLMLAEKVILQ